MTRNCRILTLMIACGALDGCATIGSTSGVATPWGAAGVRNFAPQSFASEPDARGVDSQVASLLDEIAASNGGQQLAYAPPPAR
jgi:hypothetical protein